MGALGLVENPHQLEQVLEAAEDHTEACSMAFTAREQVMRALPTPGGPWMSHVRFSLVSMRERLTEGWKGEVEVEVAEGLTGG